MPKTVSAVSYTHLDVYKRQDISWIDTTGRISSTNEIIRKDSYYDNPCMKDLCECKENIVYTGSVSYTHLDVYKRQA